jgi:chemotaxis protein histidine kinase CheA
MGDRLDLREFVEDVRAEAAEHLRVLDMELLKLEREPTNPAPIRQMFLSAHTIKGSAAMVDLTEVSSLAHAVEDVLASLRDDYQPLDTATADLLFRGLDTLRALVARSQPGQVTADLPTEPLVGLLRSRAGRGSPLGVPSGDPSVVDNAGQAGGVAQAAPRAGRPRVLLVEDSPTVRMLETMLLTDAGFEVEAVDDGAHALELALERPYQLLVTAVETRGLRGHDLAITLRATPTGQHLPIIIMSSDDDEVARQRAAEADVQAYIRKGSFGRQRLVETARTLTQR